MRISEVIDDGNWVYHGTNRDRLPSIAQHGLLPYEPGPEGWPEYEPDDPDEWDDYEPPIEAHEPRLFASVSPQFAKQYGQVLLRLPASLPWYDGEVDFPHLYLNDPIPPQQIEVLDDDGVWKPLTAI